MQLDSRTYTALGSTLPALGLMGGTAAGVALTGHAGSRARSESGLGPTAAAGGASAAAVIGGASLWVGAGLWGITAGSSRPLREMTGLLAAFTGGGVVVGATGMSAVQGALALTD